MEENMLSRQVVTPASCFYYEDLPSFHMTHDYLTSWIVFCLLRGEMHYSLEKSGEYILHEGEILLCPPYYNLDKITPGPVSVCILTYESKMEMRRMLLGRTVFPMNDRIREDLSLIAQESPLSSYVSVLQMDLWHQLCLLYREPIVPVPEQRAEGSIQNVLDFISGSLDQKLTLEMLAERSGYSPSMLIQKFKYHTGCTPIQYITALRINHAKKLLKIRNKTLREVAAECGFANEFYLSTVFRRCTGLSPSEYRKTLP